MQKVIVGLSGGVDSAMAALLLKEKGAQISGVIMSIWDESMPKPKDLEAGGCLGPEEKDIEAARKVAGFLGIPFKVIDCIEEYKKVVLENFKEEYRLGRTPNPCVWCNSYIKFGALPDGARRQGILFDKFATGHYAIIDFDKKTNRWQLKKGKDGEKDQSYFLYRMTQGQLGQTLFPLGNYTKKEVRAMAAKHSLPVADKKDSQDFYCGDYNDILKFPPRPGNIIDKTGKIIGQHEGVWNYTIGKRKGLVGGGTEKPLYVVKINAARSEIIVGFKEDLYARQLSVSQVNWISDIKTGQAVKAQVKIRRQHKEAPAIVTALEDGKASVVFESPQMSATAGQSAVFYDGDIVLGGGIIE